MKPENCTFLTHFSSSEDLPLFAGGLCNSCPESHQLEGKLKTETGDGNTIQCIKTQQHEEKTTLGQEQVSILIH